MKYFFKTSAIFSKVNALMRAETQNIAIAYRYAFAELDLSRNQSFVIKKKMTNVYVHIEKV